MNTPTPTSRRGTVIAVAAALVFGAAVVSSFAETVKGSGKRVTQSRTVAGFTGIGLGIPAQVEVKMGATEGLTIEGDDNVLALVETVVKGNTLEINPVRKRLDFDRSPIRIVVQAKAIDHLEVGGSGSITAEAVKSPKLSLDIGGSGSISLQQAEAERVAAAIGGSGSVKIGGGNTREFKVAIGGSGDVAAGKLKADEVSVSIGGSGDATVWAVNSLKMSVAGSGDVKYWGTPSVRQSVVGSGRAKQLGPTPL